MSSSTAALFSTIPKLAPVKRLSKHIIRILGQNPSYQTFQGTNSYLIQCGSNSPRNILIDTSDPHRPMYVKNVINVLKSLHKSAYISDIILTHWHIDHVGSASDLQKALKSELGKIPEIHKFPSNDLHDTIDFEFNNLTNNQVIPLDDNQSLEVVHCPGHTDDHISLYFKQAKVFFSGDMILGHGSSTFEYLNSYMKSLKMTRLMCPNIEVMLPAHGEVIKDPLEKTKEYINHRLVRIEEVYSALNAAKDWSSERDLLGYVYMDISHHLISGALVNLRQALIYLKKQNLIDSKLNSDENLTDFDREFNANHLWKKLDDVSDDQLRFEFD